MGKVEGTHDSGMHNNDGNNHNNATTIVASHLQDPNQTIAAELVLALDNDHVDHVEEEPTGTTKKIKLTKDTPTKDHYAEKVYRSQNHAQVTAAGLVIELDNGDLVEEATEDNDGESFEDVEKSLSRTDDHDLPRQKKALAGMRNIAGGTATQLHRTNDSLSTKVTIKTKTAVSSSLLEGKTQRFFGASQAKSPSPSPKHKRLVERDDTKKDPKHLSSPRKIYRAKSAARRQDSHDGVTPGHDLDHKKHILGTKKQGSKIEKPVVLAGSSHSAASPGPAAPGPFSVPDVHGEAPPPPPGAPTLQRITRRPQQLAPGAYSVGMGQAPRRASGIPVEETFSLRELEPALAPEGEDNFLPSLTEGGFSSGFHSSNTDAVASSSLVQATRVEDNEHVVQAQVIEDDPEALKRKRKRRRLTYAGYASLVVVVLVLGLSLGLRAGRDSGSLASAPSASPSLRPSSIQDAVVERIQDYSPWTMFHNDSSPQSQALDWILADERGMSLDDDELFLQRFALAVLHFATNGEEWGALAQPDSFLSESHECTGRGVAPPTLTCALGDYIASINLTNTTGLTGELPPELALLSRLTTFVAPFNGWIGTIPTQVGLMTQLEVLDLSASLTTGGRVITGTLPSEIGSIQAIKTLSLTGQSLTYPFPSEFWLLPNLTTLSLGLDPDTVVSFPRQIGSLTSLTTFAFQTNFIGSIPTEIGGLSQLTEFPFDWDITGSIPSEIGLMTSLQTLRLLNLSNLRGTIPISGGTSNLQDFVVRDTALTGTVPSEIGLLTLLTNLELVNTLNNFQNDDGSPFFGTLPSQLRHLTKLTNLKVQGTNMRNPVRHELGQLTDLELLWITGPSKFVHNTAGSDPEPVSEPGTRLLVSVEERIPSPDIPTELGKLTKLTDMQLIKVLEGTIPSELGLLSNLKVLDLASNQLSQTIPAEVFAIPNLAFFDASAKSLELQQQIDPITGLPPPPFFDRGNALGALPTPELGLATSLTHLKLRRCNLIGNIPSEVGLLSSLTTLDLGSNQLTGPLPSELGELTNLEELIVEDNNLTQSVPAELSNLGELKTLSLDGNLALSGSLPSALCDSLAEATIDCDREVLVACDCCECVGP